MGTVNVFDVTLPLHLLSSFRNIYCMNTTESVQEMVLLNKYGFIMFIVILCSLSVGIPIPTDFNGKTLFESFENLFKLSTERT